MAKAILEDQQRLLLQQERQIFSDLQACLADFEEASSYAATLLQDETIRLAHLLDLLQGERIRSTFESEVLADSATRIEGLVQEMIDWLVEQEHRQWQNVMEYIDRRRQANTRRDDQMIGSLGRQFDYNRRTLLQSVARTVYGIIQTYNPQAETAKLAQNLRATMAQMAIASVSGVGLGVLTLVLVHTLVVDVTGLFTGAVLVGLGVGILPLRRKRAQRQFEAEMEKLRARLNSTITEQFRKELNDSINRIQDAIAPYTRFVRAEQQKTTALQEHLTQLNGTMQSLKGQIEALKG